MKVGERTSHDPKEIRERFGIGPETELEFEVQKSVIILKKAPKKLNLAKWKARPR
jgi:bifunctional DNA-binding transcriptional regulator/antitoxin component of YhaV-PrlF toxin-antitoxin module